VINYAVCIFLSAFLLFQIQPVITKILLPWFGGTPAVWSCAMLFFQITLTGGYAYSNWLVKNLQSKKQSITHLILMGISICLVITLWRIWPSPITPAASWKPVNISQPILYIFLLMTISIGLPFFVLSTNSPLMQAWFSHKNPGHSPYWLYALSNIGSLLGLITYLTLIEPMLTLQWQGWIWTGGYILFVIVTGYNSILNMRRRQPPVSVERDPLTSIMQKCKKSSQSLWILLSACASLLVLAVTSQITQEVAVIPFLWVLPLSIYLLSFVLAFSSQRWYHRGIFTILFLIGTGGWLFVLFNPLSNFIIQICIYSFLLFATSMICHGELYALRPQPFLLTRFYLMVSIGGAIGGFIVNLVAPTIFRGYWELYFGFSIVWILLAILSIRGIGTKAGFWYSILVGGMAIVVTIVVISMMINSSSGNSYIHRNFYGVVRVKQMEIEESQKRANVLVHGSTVHGFQFLESDLRDSPTSYYTEESGVGLAILNNPHYGSGMRVGVLGLGVGTLAAYGQPGDQFRFYEINPEIVDLANGKGGYFSFIKDSQATIELIVGDARISLEKEINERLENNFDILVLDTFSSDSIPVHLVTMEAFDIYLQNLATDGLIAAHISNERLDLRPVFWQLAQFYNLEMVILENPTMKADPAAFKSVWVLLTRNTKLFEAPALANSVVPMVGFNTNIRLWTDDYSNLIQILR
jgi:spermidine synthase